MPIESAVDLSDTDQAASPEAEPYSAFPIVGVGASAGGLAAFTQFLSNVPADSGIAFVLVPHLDPTHESLMVELLARQSSLPVKEAEDGTVVEPNHVYLIPPNKYLAIREGRLRLSARPDRHGSPTAIDFFFDSLANEQRSSAIGIILSGTSSHGSIGLKEIKLRGGMMMAQRPDSAEFDQMPTNAIATGLIDFVLPPEQMAEALLKYTQHPYMKGDVKPNGHDSREELDRVLALIKAKSKYDFRSYRRSMVMRRVLRRMDLRQIEHLPEYVEYLTSNPEEITALYKDLLIGVTDFFRDPEAFEVLLQRVIPELVKRNLSKEPVNRDVPDAPLPASQIRVWVPACATGEEAYSIAMLLIEYCNNERQSGEIQVFATDIDEESLETARQGIYSEGSLLGISVDRLNRFFTKVDSRHWKVTKQLRDVVTVASQNLISDAPFSKMNLVSCRNLLIYLEPAVQAKVIRLFHFALSDGGYLMLGPSETIGREEELFVPISKKWRVFRRIDAARRNSLEIPIVMTENRRRLTVSSPELATSPLTGHRELMQRVIIDEFVPASALINRSHQILCVMGPLVDYLEFPSGEMTSDILELARPGLRPKVRAAIYKAIQTVNSVVDHEARVKRDGTYIACTVTVKPIPSSQGADGLFLVTFQDHPEALSPITNGSSSSPTEDDSHILQHLEQELKTTREDLQGTIEEYQSSTEDLKASNEEVMSMNEELQSSNEELESSKEELQSLNEELHTVNAQLQEKVEELDRSNSDLMNLMASSDVATLFLDTELRIKRFTPPVVKLLNLRSTDVDRPVSDFAFRFDDNTLLDECRAVLKSSVSMEKEIWSTRDESRATDQTELGDRCYLRRILPYRLSDNQVGGVVVTMVDITQRVMAETQSRRLAAALHDSSDAITLQDFDGNIIAWNRGATKIYGYTEAEALAMNICGTVPEHRNSEWRDCMERVRQGELLPPLDTQRLNKAGDLVDIQLNFAVYRDERGRPVGVATTERDISERKRLQKQILEIAAEEQRRIGQELHDGTGQELTGLSLFAGTLVDLLDELPRSTADAHDWLVNDGELQRLRETARRLAEGLSESQRHVQQLSHGILPVQIQGEGLSPAFKELVDKINTQQRVHCTFECPHQVEVTSNSAATHLYRIAQEAVNNAIRHSQANEIVISLDQVDDQVILEIRDNGIGINANLLTQSDVSKRPSGFGLGIMKYRADLIGGTLLVSRRNGGGTVVRSVFSREVLNE